VFVKQVIGRCVGVIRDGKSVILGDVGESWRYPAGWQGVVRSEQRECCVVLHAFEGAPRRWSVALLEGEWGWKMC
jgi:hypothetical protein